MTDPGEHASEEAADAGADADSGPTSRASASVLAGAVRYALFGARSWTLRTYALVGTLVATFTAVLFVLAVPGWAAATAGGGPLERVAVGFLALVGLILVAAAFLPLLLVARRHRAGRPERQRAFGLAGWGYLAALYLGLVASAPPGLRSEPAGPLAPAIEVLYGLPRAAGAAFPLVAIGLVLAVEYGRAEPRDGR